MNSEQIIRRPLILTEKGQLLREEENKYLFEVDQRANKQQIRDAVEELFDVQVTKVNTLIVRGRIRRLGRTFAKTRNWKKAIVEVAEGETIDFFEEA
ncbi:MAG: 50S ribosomal protein L23 [Sandaracinaceae bacterium]|nr:50S ribosomal protein L23 [Myxococcales bacterium]|tara:strand:- start:203 stop:493 length:291 start_codon:yes stop_codon:yes gene_type:complete